MDPKLSHLRMQSAIDDLPEGDVSDEIERQIAKSLPVIEGLCDAMTQEQRIAVMEQSIAVSRCAFIKTYGNAFGCEELAVAEPASLASVELFAAEA